MASGVVTADAGLVGRIGRAILDGLLPSRRPRVSVRKVKSPLSRWNKADPHRPARSTPVTALTVTVSGPETRRAAGRAWIPIPPRVCGPEHVSTLTARIRLGRWTGKAGGRRRGA